LDERSGIAAPGLPCGPYRARQFAVAASLDAQSDDDPFTTDDEKKASGGRQHAEEADKVGAPRRCRCRARYQRSGDN
jgi:hypothetical protein